MGVPHRSMPGFSLTWASQAQSSCAPLAPSRAPRITPEWIYGPKRTVHLLSSSLDDAATRWRHRLILTRPRGRMIDASDHRPADLGCTDGATVAIATLVPPSPYPVHGSKEGLSAARGKQTTSPPKLTRDFAMTSRTPAPERIRASKSTDPQAHV